MMAINEQYEQLKTQIEAVRAELKSEISPVRHDMREVKQALLGNKDYELVGLVARTQILEHAQAKTDKRLQKLYVRVMGLAAAISGIVWVLEKIWKQ